jgi:hypothetical protein
MKPIVAAALLMAPTIAQAQDSPEAAQAKIKHLVEKHWMPLKSAYFEVSGSGCTTRMVRIFPPYTSSGKHFPEARDVRVWNWATDQVKPPQGSQVSVMKGSSGLVFEMASPAIAQEIHTAMSRLSRHCKGDAGAFPPPGPPAPRLLSQMVKASTLAGSQCVSPRRTITVEANGDIAFRAPGLTRGFVNSEFVIKRQGGYFNHLGIWLASNAFRAGQIDRFDYLLDGRTAGSTRTVHKSDAASSGAYSGIVASDASDLMKATLLDDMRNASRLTVIARKGGAEVARVDFDISEYDAFAWLIQNKWRCP